MARDLSAWLCRLASGWASAPAARAAARWRRPALPPASLLLSAAVTAIVLAGWGVYLAGPRPLLLAAYGLAVAGLLVLALAVSPAASSLPTRPAWTAGLRPAAGMAAASAAVLVMGLAYRIVLWPRLLRQGDSGDYEWMATLASLQHRYIALPWRSPGYPATLTWIYRVAGVGNQEAVHLVQILMSLLTALAVMAIVQLLTGRRRAAFAGLVLGAFTYPLAAASAFLMSEQQTMLLATLCVLLVLLVRTGRAVAASALALGPALALTYETRVTMQAWVVLLGLSALVTRGLAWRHRAVVVGGLLLTLGPVAIANAQGPYGVLSPGPAVDLSAQNLGEDRFILYPTSPNSPELLEAFHRAIVTDGADADDWSSLPPAEVSRFNSERLRLMGAYILGHAGSFTSLSLRRAGLLFRYDQADMAHAGDPWSPWLLLVDALLLLALVALASRLVSGRWREALVLGAPVVVTVAALSMFHVETRYSLPVLPIVVALATAGMASLWRLMGRTLAAPSASRLAGAVAVVVAGVLAVTASEVWLWPALVDAYPPRMAGGAHQSTSCYVGHHLLTSVVWRPGTSTVVAGGPSGMVSWDTSGHECQWQETPWDNVWDLAVTPDGSRLAIGSSHPRALDTVAGRVLPPTVGGGWPASQGTQVLSVSLSPDGRRLAFAATGRQRVGFLDLATGSIRYLSVAASPIAVRWSPDGTAIAVSSADRTLRLYGPDLDLRQSQLTPRPVMALAWSPRGDQLAAGDDRGELLLWRLDGHGRLGRPAAVAGHADTVHGLSFSPDGRLLASAGADGTARTWDATTLAATGTMTGHTAGVWGVQWSPDSTRVVTASADGSLAVWRVR